MTMGTASTMASLVEAMGLALPTNAALPAVDARRTALAHHTGRRIVEMVEEDLKPSDILTRAAFEKRHPDQCRRGRVHQCRGASAGDCGARGGGAVAGRY